MSKPDPQAESAVGRWPGADWIAAALLAAAVWMVYGRSLDAPFIADDKDSIVNNASIVRVWPPLGDRDAPGPLAPPPQSPTAGRPLVNLSFALNYQWGGLDPRSYRAINIGLHTLNVLLVAALVRCSLRLPRFEGRFERTAGPLAFLAALAWAVHPLASEAVVYVTQRTELVVSFCYLATLYCSARSWTANSPSSRSVWTTLAIVACWAGMASKEVMVSAPVVVLLFHRTFVAGSIGTAWRQSKPLYAGLFSSWALLLVLNVTGPRSAAAGFHLGVSATEWWYTQSQMLLMYLRLAVWPWPLSIHYAPSYLATFSAAWMYALPAAVIVLAALLLLWRNSPIGWTLAVALAILAPTLLVPIVTEVAAERRMYLPLAALMSLLVVGGFALPRRAVGERMAISAWSAIGLSLACVAGATSMHRLAAYEDELALWSEVAEHQPDNATALYNVGTIYLERNEPAEAIPYFQRAIRIQPDYAEAHHNLGAVFATVGRTADAEREFQRAADVSPHYALGHIKLGYLQLQRGRTDEARKHFEDALRAQPHSAEAHRAMADMMLASGDLDGAILHARAASGHAPNDAEARNLLGAALAQRGRWQEAVEQFEAAVRIDPNLLQAQGNLMAAYASAGRTTDALALADTLLQMARAAGDKQLEEQVNTFLQHYRPQPAMAPESPSER